jgi:cellulose synthase/poly-beta-1,6-N-acetylglucosamine synthase-like glycosyltransferase
MKKLAAAASGDILIFTDANIIISTDAIDRLLPYYSDAEVGGVCCTIKMATAAGSSTSEVGADYVAIDDRLQRLESETGNVMGATGGLFSVRRKLYPEFPDTVQDDFTVSMSVIFQGRRLVKAIDVIGFERVVARSDEEFRRKVRIGARAYHTHTFMLPAIRKMTGRDLFKYISRKVLRWYGGLFLILSGVFALAAAATVWIALAVILVVGVLAAGAFSLLATAGPLAKAREILKAILATLLGVIRGMRGQTFATWAPAKSR